MDSPEQGGRVETSMRPDNWTGSSIARLDG